MTIMRTSFAAPIHKVELRQVGGKQLAVISICKKNRAKEGEEESYTWLRISLWSPPAFMVPKLVKGSFIAGSGEFSLRSYEKDGVKHQTAECNCQSTDVDVADGVPREAAPVSPVPGKVIAPPRARSIPGDEPPF